MFKIIVLAVLAVAVANSFVITPITYTGHPWSYPAVRSVALKSEVPLIASVPAVSYLDPAFRYGYGHNLPAAHLKVDRTPLEHSYEFVSQGW